MRALHATIPSAPASLRLFVNNSIGVNPDAYTRLKVLLDQYPQNVYISASNLHDHILVPRSSYSLLPLGYEKD